MSSLRTFRRLLLLMAALATFGTQVQAQDQPENAEQPTPPDLSNLQSDWWSYFEVANVDDLNSRVEPFLQSLEVESANLSVTSQETAQTLIESIRDNMGAYGVLLGEVDEAPRTLEPLEENYTVDGLLEVAAARRDARAAAEERRIEVERERLTLAGVRERRDVAFNRYLSAEPGDQKFLTSLRLIQNRSALATAERRLELLINRSRQADEYAAATMERVDEASSRLPTTVSDDQLEQLRQAVTDAEAAVGQAAERLQAAEVSAAGLSLDTPEGRSKQRLERQKYVEAQVVHALARLEWMNSNTLRIWAELLVGTAPDTEALQDLSLGAIEYIRSVRESVVEWQRDTEEELLAVQTLNRDGLNRSARRLLDQRVGIARITLTRINEVEAAADELELLSAVAERTFVENVGSFQSTVAVFVRSIKGLYLRATTLADTTLFSIGETPVAGSDILRALLILVFAFVLSRLVRHGFGRMSRSEDAGTQASLYTVGRLSHYAIFTIAVIVALASIGIDFSNVALIAGALGVGIGFGLQSIVSNFVSGLIILFEHSLRVGDYIELDTGLTGTVKAINVRSTLINTNDNIDIVVPNSEFVSNRLTNWTLGERILRVRIPFGVAYGSDKELVRKAAQEAAAEVQYTLKNMKGREPDVWLVEYGDSSLNFLLLVWVNRQGARRPTRTRAAYLWALETKLTEYGIEIPFPQRDLHLRSGWSPPHEAREEPPEEPAGKPEPAA